MDSDDHLRNRSASHISHVVGIERSSALGEWGIETGRVSLK